jgi:hypothetical protein
MDSVNDSLKIAIYVVRNEHEAQSETRQIFKDKERSLVELHVAFVIAKILYLKHKNPTL